MALTSCCNCFSLKTGTIIIGTVNMLSTVSSIILAIVLMAKFGNPHNFNENPMPYITIKTCLTAITAHLIVVLGLTVLLILGACTRRANLIFPFLSLGFTEILVFISGSVGSIALLIYTEHLTFHSISLLMIMIGACLAFKIYLWLVIYYFHQELLCEKFGRKINPQTGKILREPFEHDV